MKTIKLLFLVALTCFNPFLIFSQGVINPYINLSSINLTLSANPLTIYPPSWVNQNPPYYRFGNRPLIGTKNYKGIIEFII